MAEGDFALWSSSATSTIITLAGIVVDWDTEVVRDPSFSLVSSSRVTVAETGRYLVRWDAGIRRDISAGSPSRALVLGRLRVMGTAILEGGRAVAYWRQAESCDEGGACSATIVDLVAGEYVELLLQRIDSETAANGRTQLGSTSSIVASISLWRLKDAWDLVDLRADADLAVSVEDSEQTAILKLVTAEGGWSGNGSPGDPVGEPLYTPSSTLELLFLVCFSLDATVSPPTQSLLEAALYWDDGVGVEGPQFAERARVTSYCEAVGATTRAIATWCGLVDAAQGEESLPTLRLNYLHRSSSLGAFTPNAGVLRFQAVAIPKADVDYVLARKQLQDQNASMSGRMSFDLTVHEGASWDHDPSGFDSTRIGVVGNGQWALAFASAYARPVGGARVNARLSHQLEFRVDGAALGYAGAVSMDRGSTASCDRSGLSVAGLLRLAPGEELELYHDQKAS